MFLITQAGCRLAGAPCVARDTTRAAASAGAAATAAAATTTAAGASTVKQWQREKGPSKGARSVLCVASFIGLRCSRAVADR